MNRINKAIVWNNINPRCHEPHKHQNRNYIKRNFQNLHDTPSCCVLLYELLMIRETRSRISFVFCGSLTTWSVQILTVYFDLLFFIKSPLLRHFFCKENLIHFFSGQIITNLNSSDFMLPEFCTTGFIYLCIQSCQANAKCICKWFLCVTKQLHLTNQKILVQLAPSFLELSQLTEYNIYPFV